MTLKDDKPAGADRLRQIAEAKALQKESQTTLSPEALPHALRVHQIELEMQNEELRRAQAELAASRERYFDLYDMAPVGYCTIGENGLILEANFTAAALLDVARGTLVRQPLGRYIFKADQDTGHRYLRNLFNTGAPQAVDLRMVGAGGRPFWARLAATAASGDKGAPVCRLVISDISERKNAEEALSLLNETLERQVAERTRLADARAGQLQALAVELIEAEERERRRVADLLHDDLQQLLAAARMQLDSLSQTLPGDPVLANVNHLLKVSIDKSRRLSHELSPPVLQHSDLAASLQWIARNYREQFGLAVDLDTGGAPALENAPLKVFLFRAVQELLFNIVKHAGVKSASVALTGAEGTLSVTVSDRGRGFNRQILDSSAAPPGLGLLTLRERARHIGGDLKMESAPGEGSRFTLTVPLKLGAALDAPEPATAAQPCRASAVSACPGGPGLIRVLLADDHEMIRKGLITLLSGQPGILVAGEAANGREAIDRVRELAPDVVVMDVSMPKMDGIEATRFIKRQWPRVRVIALSMFEDEYISKNMHDAGAEAFLSKTASSAELIEALVGTGGQ